MNSVFSPGWEYIRPFPARPCPHGAGGVLWRAGPRQRASGFTGELTKAHFPSQCRVTSTENKSPSLHAAHIGHCVGTGPCAARREPWVLGPRELKERAVSAHRAAGSQGPSKAAIPHVHGNMGSSFPDTLKPPEAHVEAPPLVFRLRDEGVQLTARWAL